MPCMFKDADLDAQERVKAEFDPQQVLNPGKVFPTLRRCAEGEGHAQCIEVRKSFQSWNGSKGGEPGAHYRRKTHAGGDA